MSRIGKQPIAVPAGTTVTLNGNTVQAKGKLGTLSVQHHPSLSVSIDGDEVTVTRANDARESRAMHGLFRSLINNMVIGVSEGYSKKLLINGVGYTAQLKGKEVHLKVGFADTRIVPVPDGVDVKIDNQTIVVSGCDKQLVGQTAAAIREHRKPEPYNAKGIAYEGEKILRKQGKAFAK